MNIREWLEINEWQLYFILDENHNCVAVDPSVWGEWMEDLSKRRVAEDFLSEGAIRVSTVFLGINSEILPDRPPVLFETLIYFEGEITSQRRYKTWDEALAGHNQTVADLSYVKQVQN